MFTYPIGLLSVTQGGEPIEPPPEITSHPADQTVTSGTNGSFSVTAVGDALSYQWQVQYGGWGSWINIDGATSSSLAVDTSNRLATNQNLYRVLVRENLGTPATSNSAKLTVNRALPGTPHAWWDATEGLYQERTGGGTTVSGDTNVVGTWRDKSGNNRHFVAVSDAARPVYDATNGWIAFDGINDAMQQGSASDWSFLHNGGGATVFIVAKIGDVADPNAAYTILATRNSGLTPGWLILHDTRNGTASNRLTLSIANSSGVACTTLTQPDETTLANQLHLISVRSDGDAATVDRGKMITDEGTVLANNTATGTVTATAGANPLTLGAGGNASGVLSLFGKIFVKEIVIFNSVLSDTDNSVWQQYLLTKYAIVEADEVEVFGDQEKLQSYAGLTVSQNTPTERSGNPIFTNQPLDQGVDINFAWVRKEAADSYKMWYSALPTGATGGTDLRVCYATSSDGLSWSVSNLGLIELGGNTDNNFVLVPGWSMKLAENQVSGKYVASVGATNFSSSSTRSVLLDSSDGLTWTSRKALEATIGEYSEGQHLIQRLDGRWIYYYVRGGLVQDREIGACISDTSDYTGAWVDYGPIITSPDQDNQKYQIQIARQGRLYYGFVSWYNKTTELIGMDLYSSRDGLTWTKIADDIVPLGSDGSWNDSWVFFGNLTEEAGNQWRMYVTGAEEDHAASPPRGSTLGVYEVRYRGLSQAVGSGVIISEPLNPLSAGLTLNANPGSGSIQVELLAVDSDTPLTGYARTDCDAISDGSNEVQWSSNSAPASPYRVKIYLTNATVYSYWCGS